MSPEARVLQTSHDRPASLATPRSPRRRNRGNFEKNAWIFMRLSGILLVILTFGHLYIGLMVDEGVHRIDFDYVAERWKTPFWSIWDLLMLWLAQLHGANGVRTVINDYARKDSTRFVLQTLLVISVVFTVVLGTYVILSFTADLPL